VTEAATTTNSARKLSDAANRPSEQAAVPRNLKLLKGLLEAQPIVEVPAPPVVADAKPDAEPVKKGWISKLRPRHMVISLSFLAVVMVPSAIASSYMAFVAADQYHSSVSFSVRSISASSSGDLLGIFTQGGGGSTTADSYVLLDFILSERMVQAVDEAFGMEKIFAPQGSDYYYGLRPNLPIEDKLSYWRRMIRVSMDHTSGIMDIEVKAFSPEVAQKVASFVVMQSEKLINDLSMTSRNEVLKVAQDEVRTAENRLTQSRSAVRDYRDTSQEADPVAAAALATQIVGGLEGQLVKLRTELSTALSQMGEDTPRVRVMRSQIASIEKQISRERQRFGGGTTAGKQPRNASDVAGRIQQYEGLQTQNEFAERAYTSALGALEKARVEAAAKQRYLAVFIQPTLSELAQYPHRLMNSLLVTLGALMLWAVAVMTFYNIRDRN
jgi:capsular polysaccharide transport system permease protein